MSIWIHTINPFLTGTNGSRKKMLILITDHNSRIAATTNSTIAGLGSRTVTVKINFSGKWTGWKVAGAQWRAETNRVNAALKLISSDKIELWDITIQGIFRQGTPEYVSLLPNHRAPFQHGTMDEIIEAVGALGLALNEYPAQPVLVTLKTEVDTFYTNTLEKRDIQQQKEERVKNASDELEAARIDAALIMFRNLGVLIDVYADQPGMIDNYFQLNLIQNSTDDGEEFTGPLAPSEFKTIISSGITRSSTIYIKNIGDTKLKAGIGENGTTVGGFSHDLDPGEEITVRIQDLSDLTAYFLNLQNLNDAIDGEYEVILT